MYWNTFLSACRCRNELEKSILQKNRKKLLRWLENGCNMDAVGFTVYFVIELV